MLRTVPGLCAVCHREPHGFGWFDAGLPVADRRRDSRRHALCSRRCQDICHGRRGMIDSTPNEQAALAGGGEAAGAFLEGLGKSDLARLSVDEWRTLIEVIVTGYCEALQALAAKDQRRLDSLAEEVPF